MNVKVQSAIKLTKDQLDTLTTKLSKLTGEEVELVNKVDPEVLGGLRIVLPDRVIDMTLAAKLNQLEETLIS